jgi:acetyl-CoA carboxylase carboxyl transferase subunit alpha
MCRLKVPIICVIVGEGASGGALGIGVGDRVLMMENTWYSVISPESCSSILWKSWEYKEQAAEALKLTSTDMKKQKLVDEVIPEPLRWSALRQRNDFQNSRAIYYESL